MRTEKRYKDTWTTSMLADYWRLTPNTGESYKTLQFRGTFLPVSRAPKVLFCTFKFLCIFEKLPNRKSLYTYLKKKKKVLLNSHIDVSGTKKVNFVDQCN
jgi:hypothetical protein